MIICLWLIFDKDFMVPFIYLELLTPPIHFPVCGSTLLVVQSLVEYIRISPSDMFRHAMLSCGTNFLARYSNRHSLEEFYEADKCGSGPEIASTLGVLALL